MNSITISFISVAMMMFGMARVECFDADARFYPCSWVGKTFKVSVDTTTVGSWSFDFTGKGSMLEMLDQVLQLECVKIHGQFIILRKIGTEMMSCMSIYNITEDAFRFYYRHRYVNNPKSVCDVCHDFKPFIARVGGKADGELS
ncbi:uncharacterized protein [Mytilus edulis]|uniref:uncharacterized protein n=1 Tax=Mytilus edulis TaxID=6550 RepID=UPI0039EF1DD3